MTTDQHDDASDAPDPVTVVPVTVTPPAHRRRPVLAAGLGMAGVVTVLAACQPSSTPSAPSYTYTPPPPYTPSYTPYTEPSTTTTTDEPTTTTTPPASEGGGYYSPGTRGPGLTQACLPTPIPKGYECTCNCVPD